jgi:hypothetical protein
MALDTTSMELSTYKQFGPAYGSLTWVLRHDGHWWCNFAHYGAENHRTVLVKFDDQWREKATFTYPPSVVADLGSYSISGGIWLKDALLTTGHDKRIVYRLRLPEEGSVLQLLETIATPFPGQGIAADPATGGLVGIDRARRRVIFAQRQ